MKKLHIITILTIIAISASLISLPQSVIGSYNAISQFAGKSLSVLGVQPSTPFGSTEFYNTQDTFSIPIDNPQTLSVISYTTTCSIFNDIHLIDSNGGDYKAYNPTNPLFPVSFSLIIPNTGNILGHVEGRIFLYCNPIANNGQSLSFSPYVVGGTINMQLNGINSAGNLINIGQMKSITISPQQITNSNPSVLIGTFTYQASDIQTSVGNPSSDYLATLHMHTTGNIILKSYPSSPTNTNHVLSDVSSLFTLLIQAPPAPKTPTTCSSDTYLVNGKCISLSQLITMNSYTNDKSKSDIVSFQVSLVNFDEIGYLIEPLPIIDIYRMPDHTLIKTVTMSTYPSSYTGNIANWNQQLSIANDLGGSTGTYSITLRSSTLSDGHQRNANTVGFQVVDSTQNKQVVTPPPTSKVINGTPGTISGVKTYFLWQDVYTSSKGEYSQLGTVPTFSVLLNTNSLVYSNSVGNGALQYFKIRPMIDTSGLTITPTFNAVNLTAETITTLDPSNTNVVLSDITTTNTGSVSQFGGGPFNDMGGGIQQMFSDIVVLPENIDNILASKGLTPADGTTVNVKVIVGGTFTVTANGQIIKGKLSPMTITEPFAYYSPSSNVPNTPVDCTKNPSGPGCAPPSGDCTLNPSAPNCTPTTSTNKTSTGICIGLSAAECALANQQLNNVKNNDLTNGGCNSSNPSVTCAGPSGSTTTTCQNAITGQTMVCPTTPSTSTTPSGSQNIGTGNTPTGTGLCSTIDQTCITYIAGQITVPQLNQNIIPILIGVAGLVGVAIYIIRKRRNP